MFDIGWGELVVIGIVALIAIGPKELPTVLRTLGQWMGKVKRMASEFQGQFQEALREAELHDLKKQAEDLTSSVTDATSFDPLADIGNDVTKAAETAAPSKTETATETTIDVPPPELPAPVTNEDIAPAEPPPKQAGGKA
jgi:sec-independent protein translocase protein TatB